MKENLKPSLSLIAPYFTKSTPKYLSASAGFDALTQAIESYYGLFQDILRHGEAVSLGLIIAAKLSVLINVNINIWPLAYY